MVLGDGAAWIKTQAAWHFPDAVQLLDWAQLARSVHKAIRAACPGKDRRTERHSLYQAVSDHLWVGAVAAALDQLRALRPCVNQPPISVLAASISDVASQRAWIGNYEAWVAAGYPSGSGGVEREVEVVINRRMKKQGMRWKRANADAVVALRVELLNQAWEDGAGAPKLAA